MESPISDSSPVVEEQRLEFNDPNHTSQIHVQLNLLHKRGQFCDAKLIVGVHETAIHRAVLASASSFFYDLFMKGEEEGKNQTVFKVKDLTWETFSPLLSFIYTGRLSIPGDQVKAVYKVSQNLRISSATTACAEYLISCLTPDNCLAIRSFAAGDTFQEKINKYIADNIKAVTNSKKFYGLSRISLEIVGNEPLITRTRNEEILPEVLLWLKNKMADHKNKLDWLVEDLIVLYLSSDNSLTDCMDVEDTTLDGNDLVQDYKKLSRKKQSGQIKAKERPNGLTNYMKFDINPDQPIQKVEWSVVASYKLKDRTYMVITMLSGELVTISVHYRPTVSKSSSMEDLDSPVSNGSDTNPFDTYEDLSPLAYMSTNRCAFGLTKLNGKLFACGGYDRGECMKSSEVYDLERNVWSSVGDMKSVRGRFSIGLHDDKIYACGGSDGNRDIQTVECYDPTEGKWQVITQAPQAKASPGIVVLDGKLYMIGGCIGQASVTNCGAFDLNTNTWSNIASMHIPRYQCAVTVFKNKIYAVGGTNGWKCLNDVEIFDPQTDRWSIAASMKVARRGTGIAVYNGKIFIVGGNDGTSALNSVEVYDPETHVWNQGPTLGMPRANCGVALVDKKLFAVGGFSGKKFLNTMEFLDLDNSEYWSSHYTAEIAESSSSKMADSVTGQKNDSEKSSDQVSACTEMNSEELDKQTVLESYDVQGKGQGSNTEVIGISQESNITPVLCNGDAKQDIEMTGERHS